MTQQSNRRCVVIGAGQAGAQLVDSLRQEGFDGEIVLVGEEPYRPYQRPPLSKKFLAGELGEERLALRPEAFYDKARVDVRTGHSVAAIDRTSRTVLLTSGERLAYDLLAFTTGTRVRRIGVSGAELAGVVYSRGIDDILAMKGLLDSTRQVAIVGGGFIGLETAAVLRGMGKEVTVLEMQDRLMPRVVAPLISAFYRGEHQRQGVVVHTGVVVSAFEGEQGRVRGVALDDGRVIPAQLAVVGIGVIPNSDIAEAAGLACDNGIVVDEHARTSDPDIVAAGDVANHPNAFYGRRIRLESVHNALEQARTAAATLCGKSRPYRQYPWFWSDQYTLKLQMVGLSQGHDSTVLRGEVEAGAFSVFYFQQGRLLAVDSVNRPMDHMQARRILNGGLVLTSAQAGDVAFDLKSLV